MVHLQAIASHLVISLRFDLEVKGHMGQVKGHMGHMGPSQIRVSKQRQVGSRQRQVASFIIRVEETLCTFYVISKYQRKCKFGARMRMENTSRCLFPWLLNGF